MLTNDLTIRPFHADDLDGVIVLWTATIADPKPWNEPRQAILRKLLCRDGLFLVAHDQGRIIGSIQAGYDGVRGWIYKLAVAPDRQRLGLGCRLVSEVERQLAARGCQKINLQVRESNAAVLAFYEKCGYACDKVLSLGKALPVEDAAVEPAPTLTLNAELSLSPITPADKPALLKHLNVSDVWRQNTASIPYPYTELDADLFLALVQRETVEHDRSRNWAIRERGELIGGIGLRDLTLRAKAELGYWLALPWWGRGITTFAVRALCEDAFRRYELRKIYAGAYSTNLASCRVLEKSGFQREGVLRAHTYRDGRALDEVRYGRWRDT